MATFSELAPLLAATGRALHARGWALATSGNFSAVVRREPLVLAISRSGVDKGRLVAADILQVDGNGLPLEADARPSDETVVHLAVVRERGAGAVLHTHSVWNTLLSEAAGDRGRPVAVRLRDAEGPRRSHEPRARGVGAHPREHPGLRPDVARRDGRARPAPAARTACSCAVTASTPGAAISRKPSGTSRRSSSCSRSKGDSTPPPGGSRRGKHARATGGSDGGD